MLFFFFVILFRIFLDISYVLFVNPLYEYSGFELNFTMNSYFVSWVLYFLSLPFITPLINSISDYFLMTFVLFVLAPLTSIYGFTGWSIEPVVVSFSSFILFVFIVRSRWIKIPQIPCLQNGDGIAVALSLILIVFLVGWYVLSGAQFNLDFEKVYEYREDNAGLANVGVLAYLNNWIYKIFSIFFIAFYLYKKNYFLVALGCIAQVIFYGFSAHKGVLFSLLLVFGIWFWFSRSNKAYIVPLGLCLVFSISLLIYYLNDHIMMGSMLIRRVFYVPAYLTYQYFNFFSENPFVYWSNSIFSGFIDYPYELDVPTTIGNFEGSGSSANNGFISSGFAHFGYCGVLIYTVMFALILRFLDVANRRVGVLWLSIAISIVPLRDALISSDLLTTLLTHGLIVVVALMLMIRKNNRCSIT